MNANSNSDQHIGFTHVIFHSLYFWFLRPVFVMKMMEMNASQRHSTSCVYCIEFFLFQLNHCDRRSRKQYYPLRNQYGLYNNVHLNRLMNRITISLVILLASDLHSFRWIIPKTKCEWQWFTRRLLFYYSEESALQIQKKMVTVRDTMPLSSIG